MTKEELLLAVGQVDEALLANCEAKAPRKKLSKIAAVAALFVCVVMGVAVGRPGSEPVPTAPEPTQPQWECSMLSTMNGASAPLGLAASDAAVVWNRGTYQDENAPREMTVTFDGETYTGNYQYSICVVGCGYIKDFYQREDRNAHFAEFSVHRETGQLMGIDFATKDFFTRNEEAQALEDPRNMLPDMVRQWASYFIDTDQYEMRLYRSLAQKDPEMTTYTYEFVRKANGLDTTDLLQVMVSDRGILGWIGAKHLGWVEENRDQLEAFACVDSKALIQRDTNLTSVAVEKESYGITPEGKVVMLVLCSAKVQAGMSAGYIIVIENTAQ